jgi:hypothetical protein
LAGGDFQGLGARGHERLEILIGGLGVAQGLLAPPVGGLNHGHQREAQEKDKAQRDQTVAQQRVGDVLERRPGRRQSAQSRAMEPNEGPDHDGQQGARHPAGGKHHRQQQKHHIGNEQLRRHADRFSIHRRNEQQRLDGQDEAEREPIAGRHQPPPPHLPQRPDGGSQND